MRRAILAVAGLLCAAASYLLAWPVPVDPVAWVAPADEGLTGAYTPNDILRAARAIALGDYSGAEDIAAGRDGHFYVSVREGAILRIPRGGGKAQLFARTGGRPLGIETLADGSFAVANALLGLQKIGADGSVTVLVDRRNPGSGQPPLGFVNNLAVSRNGKIYFTDASTKFGAADYDGTLDASLLDIIEHGGHGRVLEYDPASGGVRTLMDGLNFANGIALSDDEEYLLVAETGSYRILKYWLKGPLAGTRETLLDKLPGFPDNIDNGLNGRFWIGLVAPRNHLLDGLAGRPFLRKALARLPAVLRPQPELTSHVIAINGNGQVLMNLQDPAARFPRMTGALERRDRLYLPTLDGPWLPYIDKQDLL